MNGFIGNFQSSGFNHCDQDINNLFLSGCPFLVDFVRESDNQYDPFAIRIDCGGNKIGYVPRGQIPISGSNRYCSGNYNQFFSQCLDAGMKFKGIAYRSLSSKTNSGSTRYDASHILSNPPDIFVFADEYDLSKYNENNALIDHFNHSPAEHFQLQFVCNCSYDDIGFKSSNGVLWYNKANDKFVIWCGNHKENWNNPMVTVVLRSKIPGIGLTAIDMCKIDKEAIIKHNPILSNCKPLFDEFVRRFSE